MQPTDDRGLQKVRERERKKKKLTVSNDVEGDLSTEVCSE
jgi:hypothetical protein